MTEESDKALEQFLQKQRTDGKAQGTGRFTLDPKLAAEKLRRHQLPHPSLYIVKAIQAAESAGVESVKVRVTRRRLTLEFGSECEELSNPWGVVEGLLSVHSLPDSPLRHLSIAIGAASALSGSSIQWQTPQGTVTVSPDTVRITDDSHTTFKLVVSKEVKLMSWVLGTAFVDEITAIDTRCGYGACLIDLDGRRVRPSAWENFSSYRTDCLGLTPEELDSPWQYPRKNFLERHIPGPRGALLKQPAKERYQLANPPVALQKVENRKRSSPWLLWLEDDEEQLAVSLAITANLSGPSLVGFVRHGVLLETHVLEEHGHPGTLYFVDDPALKTDLTEFQIVEDEAMQACLDRLSTLARQCTEAVTSELLSQVFAQGNLSPEGQAARHRSWHYWLQHHSLPPDLDLETLVTLHFPPHPLKFHPLPEKLETVLRQAHESHLDPSEKILLAYDDSVMGESRDGFLITPEKLCWCALLESPSYLSWDELPHVQMSFENDTVTFGSSQVTTNMNKELMPCLYGFLRTLKRRKESDAPPGSPQARRLLKLALSYLGKSNKLYYAPHFPTDKLKTAMSNFGQTLDEGEEPLVLYDDTVFGKTDNGFILTEKRISWRNILDGAEQILWLDLSPEDVQAMGSGCTLQSKKLYCHIQQLREQLVDFLKAVAQSELGAGAEGFHESDLEVSSHE